MGSHAQEISSEPSPVPNLERARSGPVLLALKGLAEPAGALRRGAELARAAGTFLAVLRVRDEHRHLPGEAATLPASPAPTNLELAERTTLWITAELGDAVRTHRVLLSDAGFDSEVVHTARMLRASLVVLASDAHQRAEHATYLALRSNVPVLVAREAHAGGAIVAATDLDTSDYPVLRRAAELARRLNAPAVFVHNVGEPHAAASEVADSGRRARLADASRMLARLQGELAPQATAVVSESATASDAVLAIAKDLDADLIVVGARQRSWLGRALGGLMAERTAWRAPRSVLIVPMPAGRDDRLG
jgi:nucleotide-binding universal stress UspA family protein